MKDKLQTVLTVSLVVFCSVIVQWNQRQTFKPICPTFCHVPCSTWAQRAWPSSSCACSFWVWCKTSSFSFWHHHAASEPGAEWTPEEREKKKKQSGNILNSWSTKGFIASAIVQQLFLCSPSECCSRTACVHLQAAFQQRSTSAGQEGFLQEQKQIQCFRMSLLIKQKQRRNTGLIVS